MPIPGELASAPEVTLAAGDATPAGETTLAAEATPAADVTLAGDATPADETPAGDTMLAADASPAVAPLPESPAVVRDPGAERPNTSGSLRAVAVDSLEFGRGAIGGVRATEVTAHFAAVGGIAASHASVDMGVVGGLAAREAEIRQGVVRGVIAQNVSIEQSFVQSVTANTVKVGPRTAILVAVARNVDGEARILLDWRGGLILGAVVAALAGLLRLSRRRS